MKKRTLVLALTLLLSLTLTACGSSGGDGGATRADGAAAEEESAPKQETMDAAQFESLLLEQPLAVTSVEYVVQDEQYKSLYPDMLQAILQNNTAADIKNAVVAFVAWDENGLPVKIKGQFDFDDGAYIKQVNYADINLAAGGTFGQDSGFSLEEKPGIASFKAIPVSFETFEGETWENPYFDEFCTLYEGQKYTDGMTVEVTRSDEDFVPAAPQETDGGASEPAEDAMSAEELDAELAAQPLAVISTQYVVQDEQYKSLYPDMLQAVLQNNSTDDIKSAVVAFVAWDANGLPVKIKGQFDFSDGGYVQEVNYDDINLVGGATFGEDSGFALDVNTTIASFKAMAVSYETFDGTTWENPYYDAFCDLYEGQKMG